MGAEPGSAAAGRDGGRSRLDVVPSRLLARGALIGDRVVTSRLEGAAGHRWHYSVLLTLVEGGPASQAALSRATGIHTSDMVAVLNTLVEAGHVERTPDPADRRRNVIAPTAAGRDRLRQLEALVDEAQDALLGPLDPAERAELIRLLTAVVDHHAGSGGSW